MRSSAHFNNQLVFTEDIQVMAKSKSLTRNKPIYSKIEAPAKPKWMRVTKAAIMIVFGILMILAIISIMMKYYHLVSTHK